MGLDDIEDELQQIYNIKNGRSGEIVRNPLVIDQSVLDKLECKLVKLKEEQPENAIKSEEEGYSVIIRTPNGKPVELVFDINEYKVMRKKSISKSKQG